MVKPIETEYAGCRFRSRTEARWAVFFDARGWRWEFEPEGFELKSGRYLPDFRLWAHRGSTPMWFEVKSFSQSCPDDDRWTDLARDSGLNVLTAYGMHRVGDRCDIAWRDHRMEPHAGRIVTPMGNKYTVGPFWTDAQYNDAWNAASKARFEFGESGAPK